MTCKILLLVYYFSIPAKQNNLVCEPSFQKTTMTLYITWMYSLLTKRSVLYSNQGVDLL